MPGPVSKLLISMTDLWLFLAIWEFETARWNGLIPPQKRSAKNVEIFDGSEDPQSSADSEKLNSCLITEFLTCIVYRGFWSNLKWESLKHLNFLDLADRSGSLLFLPCGRGHRRDLEYQWPGQSPTTSPENSGMFGGKLLPGTPLKSSTLLKALWVFCLYVFMCSFYSVCMCQT